MADEHVSVLIVGGGGVGMAAALFLARHGVRPLLLERHARTSIYPRATGLAPRTRELLRTAGLDEIVLAAGSVMARNGGKVVVEQLAGNDLGTATRISPVAGAVDVVGSVSPITSTNGICPQDELEPILLAAAREHGAEVRFGNEVVDLRQDGDSVTVTVTDAAGRTSVIAADYVIAADGANSSIRERLGIGTTGPGPLGAPMITVLFRADLTDLVRGHEFVVCEIRRPGAEGLLLAINNTDRWVFYISCPPDSGSTPADFPPERCLQVVRRAIGLPDLDIELLAVMPWQAAALVADSFQQGRVFLVGDSAHVMPPSGAYGLNTGIADAHNLAWKLAFALRGKAGTGLVDSYERERLPVGRFTVEQAMLVQRNPRLHWDLKSSLVERERLGMAHPVVVSLCPQYDSPVIASPRSGLPSTSDPELNLDGHAGSRVPHLWVASPSGRRMSTVDLCESGFVLLSGPAGQVWQKAAAPWADLPLAAYRLAEDGDLIDEERRWPAVAGIKPDGALLVRPDGYVAWRAPSGDDAASLDAVMRQVTGYLT
ncbi:FAD-dependent monooxygenase [Microtetraspora malaysiensis]|uniref:FAD-dependent monooxygenase n=1 Tax=Microtetraspora malaysiensis TaxID=161358 RepID=UPI003D8A8053